MFQSKFPNNENQASDMGTKLFCNHYKGSQYMLNLQA